MRVINQLNLSLCHQIRQNLSERQIFLPFGIELILLYGNLSPSPHDTRTRRQGQEITDVVRQHPNSHTLLSCVYYRSQRMGCVHNT
nr:hypothetical protein XfCFBP8356_11270 [Xylella fastidiosa subsp. sandyi]